MNHIQLCIKATEAEQEILIGHFISLNSAGFEQTDTHLLAYFEEAAYPDAAAHELLKKFEYSSAVVGERNWNAAWEESFEPVVVARFCAVRAHFHLPVPDVAHEIIITPKMSFGTGHHATTYMMLEHMERLNFKEKQVLDFGTGTGVLAILAEKLGAAHITAIDNDAWSFENIQENLRLNRCSKVKILLTEDIPGESYDVILANITRNVLLNYMDVLKSCLNKGGYLLMSGLLQDDEPEMLKAATNHGMKLVHRVTRAGWLSLLWLV